MVTDAPPGGGDTLNYFFKQGLACAPPNFETLSNKHG